MRRHRVLVAMLDQQHQDRQSPRRRGALPLSAISEGSVAARLEIWDPSPDDCPNAARCRETDTATILRVEIMGATGADHSDDGDPPRARKLAVGGREPVRTGRRFHTTPDSHALRYHIDLRWVVTRKRSCG